MLPITGDPAPPLARVRLSDLIPYDGAPAGPYVRAVEALSGSLMRHNAAVIELGGEDTALMRCGLESARLYFRTRAQSGGSSGKGGRGVYMYRAGRYLIFKILNSYVSNMDIYANDIGVKSFTWEIID